LADGFFEEGGKMAFKMRPNTLFHIHISASVAVEAGAGGGGRPGKACLRRLGRPPLPSPLGRKDDKIMHACTCETVFFANMQ
jgi:hypothetical protein